MPVPPSPGNPRKLQNPPKFGGDAGAVSWPRNIGEAVQFTRWLVSLWRVASESIDTPESLAFARQPGRQGSDQETLGGAQALAPVSTRLPPDIAATLGLGTSPRAVPLTELDQAAVFQRVSGKPLPDELTTLIAAGRVPYPYPLRGGAIMVGTHAERLLLPAASYPFFGFWETDRTVFYISNGTDWRYVAGVMRAVVASLPGDLGAGDVGFEFYSTDLGRGVYWSGAAWIEAPLSIRIGLDAARTNVAANEAMLTGGSARSLAVCFGDDTTNFAAVFGTPVAGVFTNRLAILAAGGLLGYTGAGPTITWQIGANGAFFPNNTAAGIYAGAGSPEGVIVAAKGSLYMQTNASDGTVAIWDKETGSGNTGWELMFSGSSVLDADHGGTGIAGGYSVGDILAASAASVLDAVPVGADGEVLTADSGAAPGVSWQAASGGSSYKFSRANTNVTLTTSLQDTGATVTLDRVGDWLVTGVFAINMATNGTEGQGHLDVGGADQTDYAKLGDFNGAGVAGTVVQQWIVSSGGSDVLKLRVKESVNVGVNTCSAANTTLIAHFIS